MKTYQKNGQMITYEVIRKNNKNAYFRIKDGLLVVTANKLTSLKTIEAFIDLKFDQFYKKIQESDHEEPDDFITLWNTPYPIILTYGNFHYERTEDIIYVRSKSSDSKAIKQRILALELKNKIEEIMPEVERVIAHVGLHPIPCKIKFLKSKFGSFHRKNREITLNSFLARLHPIYLEYVIYHEYAHALIFNHSKDFYNLLDKLMPNHRVYQKDLKKIAIH